MQRHVDPEVLEQEFNTWKESEEAKEWSTLLELKKNMIADVKSEYAVIDNTMDDFANPWGHYLEQIKRVMQVFKVPSKTAAYEQDKMRTAFFAQSMNEMTIDLRTFLIPKASSDSARDTREEFIRVWKTLDEIDSMEAETYRASRTNLTKSLGAFEKVYVKHVKSAHTEIYDQFLMPIIQPLVDVINTNKELYAVEHRHHKNKKWFADPAPEFRLKACRAVFFEAFTAFLVKLREIGVLTTIMDVRKCFEDVEIDTSPSLVLRYFLHPLKKAWTDMRVTLRKMFKNTVNLVKLPLKKNVELIDNIKNLIVWYEKCEILLGDDLKKDQLMFMHSLVSHVYLSPLRDQLTQVEEEDKRKDDQPTRTNNTLAQVIPSIAAFQGLRHMAKAKELREERKRELEELGETLESIKLPKRHILFSQDTEERFEGLPRIWLWEGFVADNRREQWESMAAQVGALNIMVQEDIVDSFISSEVNSRMPRKVEDRKKGPEELRPPHVWNYHVYENEYVLPREELVLPSASAVQPKKVEAPDTLEIKPLHLYRPKSNPADCYVDGRVREIIKTVEKMGGSLKVMERDRWNQLVREVILTMKKDPPPLEEEEVSEDEVLMHRPQETELLEEAKEADN